MGTAVPPIKRPWWGEFLNAGTAAVCAIAITNPIDVVKTRMTLQGEVGALGATHAGSFGVPHAVVIELFRLRKVLSMVEDMEEWVNSLLAADEWEAAWLRHMRARFMANEYSGLIDG